MKVVVKREAELDLVAAVDDLNEQRFGLGDELFADDEQALRSLADFPRSNRVIGGRTIRKRNLRNFPYAIIYTIRGETLLVATIAHHAQDAEEWRSRLA